MKKAALLGMALILCLCATALADTWYVKTPNGKTVNMRDETTNRIVGRIPYGTAVTPDDGKSTELSAYVTYNGASGFVSWKFLVKENPGEFKKGSAAPKETEEPGSYGEGKYAISVTGGVLQFPNKRGNASGTKYSEVRFDEPTEVVVTATVPRRKRIDYWLINGVKVKMNTRKLTLVGEDQDIKVEIVLK